MLRFLAAALLLCAMAASAQPTYHAQQASFATGDADQPALASSPDGLTMLAFHADEEAILMSFVHTQLFNTLTGDAPDILDDSILMGPGGAPAICWTREGFVLAFVSDDAILTYRSDLWGSWDLDNPAILFPGGAVLSLDLQGDAAPGTGPVAALVVETSLSPPANDFRVRYTELTAAGWSDFFTVAESVNWRPNPQITVLGAGSDIQPTVWFVRGTLEPALYRRTRAVGLWLSEEFVPPIIPLIVGEFAVAMSPNFSVDLVGLGQQPTCPCGSISHQHAENWDDWSYPESLLVYHDAYNWPMSPKVAAGANGRVHAFWSQLSSDPELNPHRHELEYHVLENGAWSDAGDFLDDQPKQRLGARVALAVNPDDDAVLAWTRRDTLAGAPQPQQIWVARAFDTTDVPAVAAGLLLDAHPNPFNPRTVLTLTGLADGPTTVEICDARGRLVRRLHGVARSDGPLRLTWDGRDQAGRDAPAGGYVARAASGHDRAACKLMLVR